MWSPTVYSDELYHHGILGMKWGVRRYQNSDGSLTSAGRSRYGIKERIKESYRKNKEMNTYNYRSSDKYKNGTSQQKRVMTNKHNNTMALLGKTYANRIDHKEYVQGLDRKKETKKAIATVAGVSIVANVAPYLFMAGAAYLKSAKSAAMMTSQVATLYGKTEGLNVVKGGFTTGFKHAAAGQKIAEAILKNRR